MKTASLAFCIIVALGCVPAPAADEPQSHPAADLATPYVDLFHGFALSPPAGAERSNERSPSQLVSWHMRDPKTNAILWTLAVGKIADKSAADLETYSKSLAATLRQKESFVIDSNQVCRLAGRDAIDLAGHTEGKVRWWQRQVWVASAKGEFVLVRLTGPGNAAQTLNALMSDILATLRIIDPKEALAQREKNLKAGAEFLKTLTAEKIGKAVQKEPRYALFRVDGKIVGGSIAVEFTGRRDQQVGFRLETVQVDPVKSEPLRSTSEAVSSVDRASGNWTVNTPNSKAAYTQTDWKITYEPGAPVPLSQDVPPEIRGCFLPAAFMDVLTRLLDLKKPFTYGFAVASSVRSKFEVYTVTVVGAATIRIDEQEVQAYRIDVQPAEDAPPAEYFVDEKGRPLRAVSNADSRGIVADTVDRATFAKAFPKALELIGKD